MKKYLILFFLVLSTQTVRAEEFIMPGYLDDEAYKYCVEMSGDYDNCLKEENQRLQSFPSSLHRETDC